MLVLQSSFFEYKMDGRLFEKLQENWKVINGVNREDKTTVWPDPSISEGKPETVSALESDA